MSNNDISAFLDHFQTLQKAKRHVPIAKRDQFSIDLPRRVYLFWDKGLSAAPDIVQLCVASWHYHNPQWDIVVLDQSSADRVIPRDAFPAQMKIAHYADMLRTALLHQSGGVWADASCLCLRPLDHWLPNLFNQSEFFAFHRPGQDRLISNWFLAARQDSVIAAELFETFQTYWDWRPFDHGAPPYFWFHALFEHLVATQRNVRVPWSQVPKLSAVPVHQLKRLLTGAVKDSDRLRDRIRTTPVQKLTHKQQIAVSDVQALLHDLGFAAFDDKGRADRSEFKPDGLAAVMKS